VLPQGTAFITDVGMTGSRAGVIGVVKEQAIRRFLTSTPVKLETAEDDPWLNAVVIEAPDDALTATSIEQVLEPAR
jgi:calcineurin-like phosphoesterase